MLVYKKKSDLFYHQHSFTVFVCYILLTIIRVTRNKIFLLEMQSIMFFSTLNNQSVETALQFFTRFEANVKFLSPNTLNYDNHTVFTQ